MQSKMSEITKNTFQEVCVPMFLEGKAGKKMSDITKNDSVNYEISLFDVKELYDLAYSKQSDSDAFKAIMAEAVQMDMAYRQQLAENASYKGPYASYDEVKTDDAPSKAEKVA
jgi:hypothetical protein